MRILAESLNDFLQFTEDNNPIGDMGIGIEKNIHIWLLKTCALAKNDYSISKKDFSINTYNTVVLSGLGISELPEYINFNYVMGGFHCVHNNLISLRGMPKILSGSFIVSWNKLENLINSPDEIKGSYFASHNNISSLEGLSPIITESLSISNNNLKNLKGIPKIIKGSFFIHNNPIETLEYFPDEVEGDLYYTKTPIVNEKTIHDRCKVYGNVINK